MVPGSVYILVALFLIKKQKTKLSPQILHDGPPEGVHLNQARHNIALTTLKFLPVVLGANILVATVQILFSQTKREYHVVVCIGVTDRYLLSEEN